MSRYLLVDGNGVVARLWYAKPGDCRPRFRGLLERAELEAFAELHSICWDYPGETWRHMAFPDYKAKRPPKPEDLKRAISECARMPHVQAWAKGYEADDVIATLCERLVLEGHEVVVLSNDKDFAQLVGPSVWLMTPALEVLDSAGVVAKWGVEPADFPRYLALAGDPTDGIPGTKGIGPKRARERLFEIEPDDMWLDLVTLRRNAPVQTADKRE